MAIYFVYLAGNHKDSSDWRQEFNQYNSGLNIKSEITLIGIDPFKRHIDENESLTIVRRDVAILSDKRLSHVILMSDQGCGMLSTGTACEMILARAMGKPVIVITSGTDKWIHPFTLHFASHIVETITEATLFIRADLAGDKNHGHLTDDLASLSGYDFSSPDIDPFMTR